MTVTTLPQRACLFHGSTKDDHGLLVFCGKPVKGDYNYCADHYRRIYQRAPTYSEIRAMREVEREAA